MHEPAFVEAAEQSSLAGTWDASSARRSACCRLPGLRRTGRASCHHRTGPPLAQPPRASSRLLCFARRVVAPVSPSGSIAADRRHGIPPSGLLLRPFAAQAAPHIYSDAEIRSRPDSRQLASAAVLEGRALRDIFGLLAFTGNSHIELLHSIVRRVPGRRDPAESAGEFGTSLLVAVLTPPPGSSADYPAIWTGSSRRLAAAAFFLSAKAATVVTVWAAR